MKRKVLVADIGGTRVKLVENAFLGGIRLWETTKHSREQKWRVT
jgi:hexokinase